MNVDEKLRSIHVEPCGMLPNHFNEHKEAKMKKFTKESHNRKE
jgi:hypothetical protein